MILNSLTLQNFRSYDKFHINFSPGVTLIVGSNASGKTNIIEAIFSSSFGRSFRAEQDREMIKWGGELARIISEVEDNQLELIITPGNVLGRKTPIKKYLVNGTSRRAIDFVGSLKCVLFWPEDLELVTDSPSLRRRYLDRVLVVVDREYRRNLYSYEKGLRQRNKILDLIFENKANQSQLLFWDQLLLKAGSYITSARTEYLDFINKSPPITVKPQNIKFQIEYDKSIISQSRISEYKDAELAARSTLVGPHRDDFIFYKTESRVKEIPLRQGFGGQAINNKQAEFNQDNLLNLSKYGSRGEQRLAILWLKLAEQSFILNKVNDRPLLLLDDIFSELDEKHRNIVLELVKNQQTIITTAESDVEGLFHKNNIKYQVLKLQNGV